MNPTWSFCNAFPLSLALSVAVCCVLMIKVETTLKEKKSIPLQTGIKSCTTQKIESTDFLFDKVKTYCIATESSIFSQHTGQRRESNIEHSGHLHKSVLDWFAEKRDGGREVKAEEVKCLEKSCLFVWQGKCIYPELWAEDDVSALNGVSKVCS